MRAGRRVGAPDRVGQRLARGQSPVGFHGERDGGRHRARLRGRGDSDRLLRVGHRERGDHVGLRAGEDPDLRAVIVGRLGGAHLRIRPVAVAARTEITADDDRRVRRFPGGADRDELRDRLALDGGERRGIVAELRRPIRVGAPRRALEDDADAVRSGDLRIAREVAVEHRLASGTVEQDERREVRQVDAVVVDQRGLEAAVGDEQPLVELRQARTVAAHAGTPGRGRGPMVGPNVGGVGHHRLREN